MSSNVIGIYAISKDVHLPHIHLRMLVLTTYLGRTFVLASSILTHFLSF